MTFVSYAQNFEDVLLWRALRHVSAGFYIDVGASHPDTDSVTRAFYDRGWHGINVEPTEAAFLRLTAARPRDVNLRLAAGQAAGTTAFYTLDDVNSGLSTTDTEAAARYAGMGLSARRSQVQTDTLAAICHRHAPVEIHFLKIDVEGAERAVLEGADFTKFRPWIVLAEATAPMSTHEVHGDWEGLLEAAAYRFVWFDGLNRFYVAQEHHEALAPSFRTPPNVFDDFLRAADTEWTRRIQQAETRGTELSAQVVAMDRRAGVAEDRAEGALLRLAHNSARLAEASAQLAAASAETARQRQHATAQDVAAQQAADQAGQLNALLAHARQEAAAAEAWLQAMRSSTSWRLTGPVRRLVRLANRLRAVQPALPDATQPLAAQALPAVPAPAIAVMPPPAPAPRRRPVHAVHQFHSGSALGDAITNAMLLTRDLLRRQGYDSRIFVEHKDPSCGDEIHTIDELPQHDGYVLIVRHSMGHDALPRILALPVAKILIYHNITPPELLSHSPFLQRYAVKGREQLAALRGAVAATLADSEYNALELRQAGFDSVVSCPLLFDVDRIVSAPPDRGGPIFTILFVGRIAPSKGQRELVQAFARFRALYRGECRLVLVGRYEADPYLSDLLALIRQHKLDTGAVELAGFVRDDELRQRYAEADLYVSLSHHEGFGVPLIEAMAHGVPVLAWPSGAVPYTLGGAAVLLEDTTPEGVARQMLALAADPAERAAIAGRQRGSLDRFQVGRWLPVLLAALARAGAGLPPDRAAQTALAANIRFTVAGHVNGTYSLAEVNRALGLAIEAIRPGAVRLLAVEGDVTTDVSRVPAEQRAAIRTLLSRPDPDTGPHVVISHHYPVWVPPEPGDLPLALFFWEESGIPAGTVATLNAAFRGVLAPTAFVAKALIDSGVTAPVRVLRPAPQLQRFEAMRAERAQRPAQPAFTFLHVSSCFPRKGIDVLLAAYARAFRRGDPVRLVIKSFPNPHNTVADQLARLQAADPDAPAIELIDRDLLEDELLDLYRAADVMVLPTRGEGFNLPAAEALAAGLPLIVTGMGGHMDFVADHPPGAVRLLAYAMAPSGSHLASAGSLWAEPDEDDLVAALGDAMQAGRHQVPAPPAGGAAFLVQRLGAIVADLLLAPPPPPALHVDWVTTWDVRCGIAEYSRFLVSRLASTVRILADTRSAAAEGAPPVLPAWRIGDEASLRALQATIMRRDPEAIVLQHQPSLVGWRSLPTLLTAPALHGRVVCATLHNTRSLLDVCEAERRPVLGVLASLSRVVVHTVDDVNRLARLGLAGNVTMIPQGAPEPAMPGPPPARALDPSQPVLIGCYGFFLPGKGIPELIEALAIVRRTWTRARLRLVNAEYPAHSAEEIERSRAFVDRLELGDAVAFETRFMANQESLALLGDCDLAVLPYQQSTESSSAALRGALAAGIPVAVTPLALFDEAAGAVIRLSGTSPQAIADGITAALLDQDARRATAENAAGWLAERSWTKVAARWDGMLRGLSASGIVMGRDFAAHPVC